MVNRHLKSKDGTLHIGGGRNGQDVHTTNVDITWSPDTNSEDWDDRLEQRNTVVSVTGNGNYDWVGGNREAIRALWDSNGHPRTDAGAPNVSLSFVIDGYTYRCLGVTPGDLNPGGFSMDGQPEGTQDFNFERFRLP